MASRPPQKIITYESFKAELEFELKAIIKTAEDPLKAEDGPMTFNRDSLVQPIKQRMLRDVYIVQANPVDPTAGLGPYFYKLPRELRDQIFSHLVASGHLSFMRTSRAMMQEGKYWISEEGIYGMSIGFFSSTNCQKPTQRVAATIQKVDIMIDNYIVPCSTVNEYPGLKLLDMFAGPSPHRKTCTVSFDHYGGPYVHFGYGVLSRLHRLRGFEKVVLQIGRKWTGGATITSPLKDLRTKLSVRIRYRGFKMAQRILEPFLGIADLKPGQDGWSMVFYPHKIQESGQP